MRFCHLIVAFSVYACGGRETALTPQGEVAGSGGVPEGAAVGVCNENGLIHPNGATWTCSDGCNTCSCENGKVGGALHGCPPQSAEGGVPSSTKWIQGAVCLPGSFHEFVANSDSGACLTLCDCQGDSHLTCITDCGAPFLTSPPPGCTEGASCIPGGCGAGVPAGPDECKAECTCDGTGHFRCAQDCPNACGLPEAIFCSVCRSGEVQCSHYILIDGACQEEICPEDGPIRPL
jgi:hypothetical protein